MGAGAPRPFTAGTPLGAMFPSYRGYGGQALMKPMPDGVGLSPRGVGAGQAGGQAALLQSSLLGLSAALAGGAGGALDPQVSAAEGRAVLSASQIAWLTLCSRKLTASRPSGGSWFH